MKLLISQECFQILDFTGNGIVVIEHALRLESKTSHNIHYVMNLNLTYGNTDILVQTQSRRLVVYSLA